MKDNVIVRIGKEKYTTEVNIQEHQLIADEPLNLGGLNQGPNPTGYLLSALGSCKAITMRMYADMKKWPLEQIEIHMSMENRTDGSEYLTNINVNIKLTGELNEQQRERILKVADKCPVHKILSNPINIHTKIID